jgi:carboxylesterase
MPIKGDTLTQSQVMPGGEPFWFDGNEVGCLVCHGFTGTPQTVRYLGEYLARQGGFTVSGPLLAGHGTRPEDMALCTAEDWIRDVERALRRPRGRCSRVFCMGLSMGGTLTLYAAAMHPEMVSGAITINAAIFLDNPNMAALAFAEDPPPSYVGGDGPDYKMQGVVEVCYPFIPIPPIRHLYALEVVTRELLPRVVCPTLVFQSRVDYAVPPSNGPYIVEHIGARDKQLVWLENSYHVATLDGDKELIAEQTLQFIQNLVKPGKRRVSKKELSF